MTSRYSAPPAGFEPATSRVETGCSNPLSYGGLAFPTAYSCGGSHGAFILTHLGVQPLVAWSLLPKRMFTGLGCLAVKSRVECMSEDGEGDIQEKGTAVGTHRPRAVAAWPMYVASAVVAAVVAGALSYSFLGESLAALGIPDPGVITTFGLPFLRGMAWMLMALATGSWMFSAFLIPPDALELHDAHLTVDGHIASRTASLAMLGVAAISLVMVPLVLSDVSGTPFADVVFAPGSWALALDKVADAQVWGLVALFAMVVGFSGLIVGGARASWGSQVALFLGSIVVIMPSGCLGTPRRVVTTITARIPTCGTSHSS